MTRKVVWADVAVAEYVDAIRFIAAENPGAAGRVAARIQAAAADLGEFALGRRGRVSGTFEKVVRGLPYILAYEIAVQPGGGEQIAILRVIHGARDWTAERWPEP